MVKQPRQFDSKLIDVPLKDAKLPEDFLDQSGLSKQLTQAILERERWSVN